MISNFSREKIFLANKKYLARLGEALSILIDFDDFPHSIAKTLFLASMNLEKTLNNDKVDFNSIMEIGENGNNAVVIAYFKENENQEYGFKVEIENKEIRKIEAFGYKENRLFIEYSFSQLLRELIGKENEYIKMDVGNKIHLVA